jgi:hypothetical protein
MKFTGLTRPSRTPAALRRKRPDHPDRVNDRKPHVYCKPSLLSRSQLYRFELLSREALVKILLKALRDEEKGLGSYQAEVTRRRLNILPG